MKKGFTLVELLAILVILGVITLVAVPSIITSNKKSKDQEYVKFKKTIENAAEVYVETHLDDDGVQKLKNNGTPFSISINDLIATGLISGRMTNPKTEKIMVNESEKTVLAKKEGNEIEYTYQE